MRFVSIAPAKALIPPRVSLLCSAALAVAAAIAGCTDEPTGTLEGTAAGGSSVAGSSAAGSANGGSANGGSASGGSASGSTTISGSAGQTGSGGTSMALGGSGGTSAGSGGLGAGSAGGGAGGAAGTAGGGGMAGGGAICPSGGAGGAPISDPTGDADNDGIANCVDACPDDPNKKEPGACGCGTADLDDDGDGALNCNDPCPDDELKTEPGVCGCGQSDTANADGDAAVDCKDACPKNPELTVAGACGCLPDSLGATCLAHRYPFDGTGTVLTDTIAGAPGNGAIVGATLSGSGTLVLAGGSSDQYATLPSGVISALGVSATIEAWVSWSGSDGGDWQRIFDFGNSTAGAGMQGDGEGYVFLTPRAAGAGLRVAISAAGGGGDEDLVTAAAALPAATLTHVAVVIDGASKTLSLYQDGTSQGTPATIRDTTRLTDLTDANNWLGRSQYGADPELAGTFTELRIYSKALSAQQIAASFGAGPDALP